MSRFHRPLLASAAVLCLGHTVPAAATTVTSFDAVYTSNGSWFNADVRPGGTASIVSLTGAGGNLESAQPSPSGAAKLTTDMTDAAKAEVAVNNQYGKAGDILRTLNVSYSFYRDNLPGGNAAAAPSLKLSFYNPNFVGDGFVSLVYESYLQTPALTNPTPGVWTSVAIDFNNGLFWGNGGFNQPNSFGGPPLRTLAGWLAAFDPAFANADMTTVAMGVGTFNPGQIGYFDDVRISHGFGGGFSAAYDFQAARATLPEPGTMALVGLALFGAAAVRRRS